MKRETHKFLCLGNLICKHRHRSLELVELITRLRKINIFPNSLPKKEKGNSELLAGEKAHLIYLMPEVVECMTTKEASLREVIKDLIKDVNKMMLGELVELTELPEEDE